jgi:hypothetical protein
MNVPSLQLSEIDLSALKLIVERLVWRDGVDHSRWVFQSRGGDTGGLVYKIWNPGYIRRDNLLTGLTTGLYTHETVPALHAVIMSGGMCRGYVMRKGVRQRRPSPDLVYALWEATRRSGHFLAQYRMAHTVAVNGKASLIDLEAVHAVHGEPGWPIGKVNIEDADYATLVRRLQNTDLPADVVHAMADLHIARKGASSVSTPWISRKLRGARKRLIRAGKIKFGDQRLLIQKD